MTKRLARLEERSRISGAGGKGRQNQRPLPWGRKKGRDSSSARYEVSWLSGSAREFSPNTPKARGLVCRRAPLIFLRCSELYIERHHCLCISTLSAKRSSICPTPSDRIRRNELLAVGRSHPGGRTSRTPPTGWHRCPKHDAGRCLDHRAKTCIGVAITKTEAVTGNAETLGQGLLSSHITPKACRIRTS